MTLPATTRRKAKAPKPDFYPVGDPFVSYGFPCKIERERAGGPAPYLMTVDSQVIGYARSEGGARATIDEYCSELSRHTRATTADMAADAAAFRAELAERAGPEWNCTPENPCDGECAEHSLDAALEDAVTAAEPWHRAAWREDWHRRHPATPARAASAQTPPSPPRTVSELQEELERVTDAIHDRKAVGAGYARLHQQRSRIIAELDAAHTVEHKAVIKPCFTCGRQFISKGPRDILCSLCACPASGANTKSIAPADPLDADISTLGLSPEIERLLVGTPNPICSVCGAPATISFAHTWFCGEHNPCPSPPYAALSDERENAMRDGLDAEHAADETALDQARREPPTPDDPCAGLRAELREAQEELEYQGKALQAALDQVERTEDAITRVLLARNDMPPDRFVSYFDEVLTPILQGALDEEDEEDEQNHRPDGPFASLRDMVYTECPCGCGSKDVCEVQRARVKAHDDAIPF